MINVLECEIVEESLHMTLFELCHASQASEEMITSLVLEGVLEPSGQQPQEWQFGGASLRRAKLAQHLSEELEINTPGVALALDLLERIDMLQARLTRLSRY